MSTKPVFISYSRKDTDFVNGFIEKLRDAGVNLWIDKNIKLGGRWDNSIETALESCDDVLVIASANSMESNNVLDEVAYALEENKRLIPIRIEDCEMNFRLRRIQHLDYFEDEEGAFQRLLVALDQKANPGKPEVHSKTAHNTAPKQSNNTEIVPQKKIKFKNLIAIAIVLGLGIFIFNYFELGEDTSDDLTDQQDWDSIAEDAERKIYEIHQDEYPDCAHKEQVSRILFEFDEDDAWDLAYDTDNSNAYINYIKAYGKDGYYYADAITELKSIFIQTGWVKFNHKTFKIFDSKGAKEPRVDDLIFAKIATEIYNGIPHEAFPQIKQIGVTTVEQPFIILSKNEAAITDWIEVTYTTVMGERLLNEDATNLMLDQGN